MRKTLFALFALVSVAFAPPAIAQQRKPVAKAAKQAPVRWESVVVRTPEGGYRQGNPNARLKLIEYGSRTCPTCGRFAAEGMAPLREKWIKTGKLSFEYRDFLVHGAPDFALALLNQCVPTPSFFRVLDALYANQQGFVGALTDAEEKQPALIARYQNGTPAVAARGFAEVMGAIPFMQRFGVTPARARQCLADPAAIKRIAKTFADGVNVQHVDGTPSFFLNGRKLSAYSWAALEPELNAGR